MEYAVTIVCLTYNQECYIEQAIKSFLVQETNFKYQILIHDDKSTDRTVEILKKYEKAYPEKVKCIYETENQHSKGGTALRERMIPFIKSKYVAMCEGDDFWCDIHKLQKQYDIMESNPEIDICSHKVKKVDETGNQTLGYIAPAHRDCVLSTNKVILGGGSYVGTNSLFMRSTVYTDLLPFYRIKPYDYTIQISGALKGGMYYINECMSCYRVSSVGSWSIEMKNSYEKKSRHMKSIIPALVRLDKDTEKKYHFAISIYILKIKIKLLIFKVQYNLKSMKLRA